MPKIKYYDPTLGPIEDPNSWKHADDGGTATSINDSAFNTMETLSSMRSADLFGVSLDVEAEIVSESFIENYPLEVISKIEAKPGGGGEFIPETEAKLHRCGKNLIQIGDRIAANANGMTLKLNDDGSLRCDGTATKRYEFYANIIPSNIPAENLYLSGGNGTVIFQLTIKNDDGQRKYIGNTGFLNMPGYYLESLGVIINPNVEMHTTVFPQLEFGPAATAFEPYKGTDYTVRFGQDVYGGEFNWKTGILTKTIGSDGMPLPTPITVQLAPREILASKGISTFFSDTGNTHVIGAGDVKAYIDKKFAELATAYNGGVNA